MNSKIEYTFDHKRQLLKESYTGIISYQQIITHAQNKFSDSEHNSNYNILTDFRGSDFSTLSHEEKEMLYPALNSLIEEVELENRKCAILTDEPTEVVNAELFARTFQKHSSLNFKTFSTEIAALNWLCR